MKNLWTSLVVATTFVAIPVAAQRGVGLGNVGGSVGGALNGTVSRPQVPVEQPQAAVSGVARGAAGVGMGRSENGTVGLAQNAELSSRLQTSLPAGTTLSAAAAGFKNEGQFLSAVHVAHNLNIPFTQLKSDMTGTNSVSLGKAIQKLRPELGGKTVKSNIALASHQAERDTTESTPGGKRDSVATHLTTNTQLAARLTPLLPSGTTLASAATGFKNEGQFIAALHVAKNLNIPFAELKDRVTAGESLGAAIHDLKPAIDSKDSESGAATAEQQARDDQSRAAARLSANAQVNAQ